ncbi:hypothetical protein [Bernardetia sp.]|uniref:hypothetical protein n=1 Tax=Bernardetia sp. TaxID=1937974 RepID=UPI0025C574C5|nr:hypothetical protein [Bernardetia sp.]
MKNQIKETIKGDWKIIRISKDDEEVVKNQIINVDIEEYQLIHIPTNKVVKIVRSYEQLTSVGSYEYFDWISFSEDGLSIFTIRGKEELLGFLK